LSKSGIWEQYRRSLPYSFEKQIQFNSFIVEYYISRKGQFIFPMDKYPQPSDVINSELLLFSKSNLKEVKLF